MQKLDINITHEDIMKRINDLIPVIESRASISEEKRHQPKETIDDFISNELIRILMPQGWGGYELGFNTLYKATAEISKADPSAGWCYGLLALHSWMLASYPEQAQKDVWEDNKDACIATSFGSIPGSEIIEIEGGYNVSGRWGFSSGIDHSDWAMIFATIGKEHPQHKMLLVPKQDFTVLNTWHTIAQRGTGSNNIELTNVFIPKHRAIDMVTWCQIGEGPGQDLNDNSLYNKPLYAIIPICLASAILGATQGAYNIWTNNMKKKSTVRGSKVSDFTHQQIRIGEVSGMLAAAESLMEKSLRRLEGNEPIDMYERLSLRRNYGYIAKLSKDAMQMIFHHSGASSIFEMNPLQRYWRDVQASSMHITFNMDHLGEMFGKTELGLPLNEKDNLLS